MKSSHDTNVTGQFGPRARAYVESAVHAQGADLARIAEMAAATRPGRAIDLGCGGGHVTYAMAPHAGRMVACDLSDDMLTAVADTARSRDMTNVETARASVEALPFADGGFDMLGCRFSAHHWQDVDAGLREARRVLKPGAPALFVDVVAPDAPLLDTHLQAVELLRDTSHVRDYAIAEWREKLARAGFTVATVTTWRLRMEFPVWIARMATPATLATAIRVLQDSAPEEVRQHFAIEPDGSFMLDMAMFEAVAG
ncbi:MAG: class I SAM-dependent methyltransferase [Rhizobiaceae bacterium]|nr:class I SAM-dependent methyltransferase [Rhizobiaceae bacterium]